MSQILIRPIVTEKASNCLVDNQYIFLVTQDANKIEIKQEIERQFGVLVESVNVINIKGKKRNRPRVGFSKPKRKAVVTLKEGQSIESMKALF